MKKTNFYFGFLRVCVSAVLALILCNVQVNAQSCPIRCNDNVEIAITTGPLAKCSTPVSAADFISIQGLADLTTCIGASNSVQTQIKRGGVWSPALGTGNASVNSDDVGKELSARVVVFNTTTRAIVNSCDHPTIKVVDNQPPTITRCVRDVALFCSQLAPQEFPSKALTGNFFAPAATAVGALDGTFTDCTMLVEKDESYTDFDFTTDCKNPFESNSTDGIRTAPTASALQAKGLTAADAADVAARIQGLISTGDVTRIIVRCWRLTDHYFNVSAPCYQIIVVRKVNVADVVFPDDVMYSCSGDEKQCTPNLTAAPADLSPATTGWPYIELNGVRGFQAGDLLLDPTKPNSCNITVKFEDHKEDVCKGSFKIFRKFIVRDWCNTSEPIESTQAIKVLDFKQPIVRADYVDYGSAGGNLCYIDQWGQKVDYAVRRENPVKKDSILFDGFDKQCGAQSDGTIEELNAQADVNVCDRFFVRFTITACDPQCTNGDVKVSANTNLLSSRIVRRFVDSRGINNVVYEFAGMITDVNQDGSELVTFTAADECGYALAKKTFRIRTEDNAKPVATCITSHTTSLGTDGISRIYAPTFNNGSKDNCGVIEKVMVRRMDNKAPQDPTTVADGACPGLVNSDGCYRDYVEFGCADAGKEVMVELAVIDQRGNFNTCMVVVKVDNKGSVLCLPPPAATTSCIDIEKKVADPVRYGFGTAAAIYNCGFTLQEEAPKTNFEACYPAGKNFFTRTWSVLDCDKKKVAECTQNVTVTNVSDFTVDFPDDVVVGCYGDIPSKDALKAQMVDPASFAAGRDGAIKNDGCGVLAVEIKDDTLMATNDLECMKILRRIKVIDWCKYNPNNDAVDLNTNCYGLPVCGDSHSNANWRNDNVATWQNLWRGHLINRTTLSKFTSGAQYGRYYSWIVTGSPTGDFTFPIDNANWDRRFFCDSTRTFRELIRERRFRDADVNILANESAVLFNGFDDYVNWLFYFTGFGVNLVTNPTDPFSYSDGILCFTQIIKVIDRDAPVAKVIADANVCADNANCTGDYRVTLEATDKCSATDPSTLASGLRFSWSVFSEAVSKDPNFSSLLREGTGAVIDLKGLAVGSYIIRWSVKDRCGNASQLNTYRVTVKDCKAPEILTHDKNAELAWNNVAKTGMVEVRIDQVLNGVKDNCTAESFLRSKLGVEKVSSRPNVTVANYGTLPTSVMFTCADFKVNPVQQIRVWTIDEAGNANFVITTITLQDNGNVCNQAPIAQLAGTISTENNAAVAGVTVNTTGEGQLTSASTTNEGAYELRLISGADYLIRAAKAGNDDKYAGLSTDDVGYIIRHALDVERIGSAYAHIAGDVNKDGEVNVADAFALRQFVLRKSTSLGAGVWRFVDKGYSFKNATNPLGEDFPEVVSIKSISAAAAANFVAVKVGDVSGNYKTVRTRSANTLSFETEDINLIAGNEYTVSIKANKLEANDFQGTFSFAKGTANLKAVKAGDLKDMTEANFGIFADAITASWNGKATANANVVTITFVANKSAKLSDVLSFGSEMTEAVATDANGREMNVNLKFNSGKVSGGEFALYQNTPNPVGLEGTLIKYNMPKEGNAKLTVYNVEGKVLMTQNYNAKAGENTIELSKSSLTSGVLYYRIETADNAATKKMIVIE